MGILSFPVGGSVLKKEIMLIKFLFSLAVSALSVLP